MVPRDGGDVFPREALYPEQHMFADPNSIGKETYAPVCDYIPRTVLPHSSVLEEGYAWFFSKDKETALQNALLKDEKVLFLSDAGQGKSIEMENLAHNLGDTMYFPFLFKLRNYTGTAIDDLLPESYNKVPPHYLALLFDGYDELPEEYRRKFGAYLNLYVEKTPGVHVVISSRSNFCKSEKENESRTFPGFHIYDLCELTAENIDSYLQFHGIEPKQFNSEARRVGIRKMLTNAFYLTKVSALYQKNGTLPPKAELMDKLVEMCFDTDNAKFIEDLEGNYCELMRLLKRVAFAMQLMQQSKLDDRSEYQALFTNVEREMLMHSGLIVKEGESWRFIHNNFREYLTAQYLAEMDQEQVISYISSDAGINPSWVNVLGYLTGISMSWDLIGWIAANAPNALVKYESDQVDPDTRFIIFTRIFNYYEEKGIWFRDELCNEEELANFSASDTALTFLLEKIANPVHVISQYTAVDILRHYRNLYGRQVEVLNCLINCCKRYPETRKDVCRLAIFAISQLDLNTPEVTQELIALFQHTDSDYVRLGIYEYLVETKEQNEYVDFFLYGIRFISHELEWNNKRVGNEAFSLVDGLKSMSTVDSVSAVLIWFGKEKTVDFHDSDELFVTMTRKAAMLYQEGAKGLFDIVLECCVKFLRGYDHEEVKTCVAFFQDTGTMEAAVLAAAQYLVNDIRHLSDMIYLCPEALGFIQKAYDEGGFNDHEAFRSIAVQHADDDDTYAKCSELLAVRTGLPLPVRGPRINHYLERRKGEYEYFEALFSKEKAEKMLAALLTAIGKPDILVKDLLRESMDLPWYSPLKSLKIAIYHGAPKEERAADFFADLEFDRFTIVQCKKILSSKTEVVVSNKQKEHIKDVICHYLKQDVLKSEVWCKEGHAGVTTFVDALVFLAQYFDFSLDEDKLLDMTLVPELCFGESHSKRKYEYLKAHVPMTRLKARIAQNLNLDDLDSMIFRDHLEFCSNNKYDIATVKSLAICNNAKSDWWVRSAALDYLYAVYGASYICNRVLPNASGEFLLEIVTRCKGISSQSLRHALEMEYGRSPTYELMAHLITLGSRTGIEDYVKEVTQELRIPEKKAHSASPTRAIGAIENPEFLPLLGQLIDTIFIPSFIDEEFFGLRSSLGDALVKCGKNDPEASIALIEQHRSELNGNIQFCNHLIEEIKRNKQKIIDQPKSLREVKLLLASA